MTKAVGFYWTLPAPWAGFTDLGSSIDEAARRSRTIRYQREMVRDFAQRTGFELVHEEAFLEIEPDRGSELIIEALDKAATICRQKGATLLLVDFSGVDGWRKHHAMLLWLKGARIDTEIIEAVPIEIDGATFYPHVHFGRWRAEHRAWQDRKEDRVSAARAVAEPLRTAGASFPSIAESLNNAGLKSATGKPWTGEGVRKLLNSG